MYRIRLQSGEEAVYKTVEELAAAVTSGMISPTAEVFHKAGNRWLPINTHPDYRAVITAKRKALQEQSAKELQQASAGPPAPDEGQAPGRSATRKSPAVQFEVIAPAGQPSAPAPPTVKTPKIDLPDPPAAEESAKPGKPDLQPALEESAKPGRLELQPTQPGADPFPDLAPEPEIITLDSTAAQAEPMADDQAFEELLPPGIERPKPPVIPIAIGVTGLLVAAGLAAVIFTRPPSPRVRAAEGPAAAEVPGPAQVPTSSPGPVAVADSVPVERATPSVPSSPARAPGDGGRLARPDTAPVVYPAPSKPLLPSTKSPPAQAQPAPPRTVSRLGTTVNRMPSYYEAYADARAEMDESLAYVDFRRVFAGYRFASPDSIRSTRRMVAAAGNILRVYRGREVMLEQTYRPGEPEGKGSLREAFEVSEASRALLADVDSLFAILVGQEGEVKYRDNALVFQNRRAAQAYAEIRRRVLQTLGQVGDPAEAADRVTMPRLLRGIGTDRPPPAR